MPRRMVRSVFALAAIVLLAGSALAQLPREITSQYRPAVEKLREAYTHATFRGTSTLQLPTAGKTRTQDFVYRASGQSRRLEVTTTAQQNMSLRVGAQHLRVATPGGSLSTFTTPGRKVFDDAKETSYGETVSRIDSNCLINYPYALDSGGTILDALLKPGVKIISAKQITAEGESFVQISYEEDTRHVGHSGLWKTRLVLSPAEGWALRGFTRTLTGSQTVTQRAKISYSGMRDGIPLVGAIESETLEDKTATRREAVQITDAKLGDPDGQYFTAFEF